MKKLVWVYCLLIPYLISAQDAESYFHSGSQNYIHGKDKLAKSVLEEGLRKFPNDPKLKGLLEKIKEDQKEEDQQNQEQNKDEEKSDEQKEQEKKEDSEKKEGEKEENENQEGEEEPSEEEPTPEEQMKEKLKEMNISEEKAQMILEAMKNNEVQYLQQQKRKATKRPPSGKPDW